MHIGFSTGFADLGNYWGGWPWVAMFGGCERIVTETAAALADLGHKVTVRLPYTLDARVWRGVRWIGHDDPAERYDVLFAFDDFKRRDHGARVALVTGAYDKLPHTDFDQLIFLSRAHADYMGHSGRPVVGGGVSPDDYRTPRVRLPRRVICTSSPDRCTAAALIAQDFDFVQSYRPVRGLRPTLELDRPALVELQQTAQALIYPLDPIKPSDFFSMSVLESLAAGTPVITSDADAMVELWADAAVILPRPIDIAQWNEELERVLTDRSRWKRLSEKGRRLASTYSWETVAERYLAAAA